MRTLYQWQDDNGGWNRGRLVVSEDGRHFRSVDGLNEVRQCTGEITKHSYGNVLLEPIHRTQFQPMVWVAVSKLQVAPTGEERNG